MHLFILIFIGIVACEWRLVVPLRIAAGIARFERVPIEFHVEPLRVRLHLALDFLFFGGFFWLELADDHIIFMFVRAATLVNDFRR